MTLPLVRRATLSLCVSIAALACGCAYAADPSYPARPIRIIDGFAAGGGTVVERHAHVAQMIVHKP